MDAKTLAKACSLPANVAADFAPFLDEAFLRFDINTPQRQAAFLGQCAHESAGFTRLEENLNYSAQGLIKTWPSRFKTLDAAKQLERQPTKIANLVYAKRLGNGASATGDGWRYRGRGLLQITGFSNYRAASLALGVGDLLVRQPDQVAKPKHACMTAAWFWSINKLNQLADGGYQAKISRAINLGDPNAKQVAIGESDRLARVLCAEGAICRA